MTSIEIISAAFRDPGLLSRALTHKSYHFENIKESTGHNERLEFLGDAVLDLALTDELMSRFGELAEGELSKIRASLVNELTLAELAKSINLASVLRMGRGEKSSGGADKPRLLASALEALIGAYYLDSGFDAAKKLILDIFAPLLADLDMSHFFKADYKTRLQEHFQATHKKVPIYDLEREEGPDHDKTFYVRLSLDEKFLATGVGRSKKQAEQDAARQVLETQTAYESSEMEGKS